MVMEFTSQHDYSQLPTCLECNADDWFPTTKLNFAGEFREPTPGLNRKLTTLESTAMALVARSMTRSEVIQNYDDQKAVQKEWTKLQEKRIL